MKIILETERLRLREFEETPEDIEFLFSLLGDPNFFAFLGGTIKKSLEECRDTIRRMRTEYYEKIGCGLWLIEVIGAGEFAGYCGYLLQEIDGKKEYEIAYGLLPSQRGKGYCTEAAIACRKWGVRTLNLTRIISIVHVDNHPSHRVAERNEMHVERETTFKDMPVKLWVWESE